jgi:integrase/recombinase XerD
MTEISPLRRRMIEDMTVRNKSPATRRSYVPAIAKFGRFFGRAPDKKPLTSCLPFGRVCESPRHDNQARCDFTSTVSE